MRSCLLSGNVLEAVVAFHERSVRAQREEADYIHLDTSAVYSAVETSRKRLSRALLKLIETCVSETLRHQRQFRMKYTEDLNMESIEECLISAANKVLDVSASDRSLVAVRPIARTFLDTLARVQTQVDTVIETNNRYRKMLSKGRAKRLHIRRNSSVTKLPFFKRAVAESDSGNLCGGLDTVRFQALSTTQDSLYEVIFVFVESEVATVATRAQHRDKQTLPSSASLPALPVAPNTDEFHRDSRDPKAEMRDLIGLLIEVDHDMAIFEFALISSVSRRLRSEAEAGEVQSETCLQELGLSCHRQIMCCSNFTPNCFCGPGPSKSTSCHVLTASPRTFTKRCQNVCATCAVERFNCWWSTATPRLHTVDDCHLEVAVLFSETLMWARAVGLVDAQRLADRDPVLLVALPRLAVFAGCYLLPDGPIGPNRLNTGPITAEPKKGLCPTADSIRPLNTGSLKHTCWCRIVRTKEIKGLDLDKFTLNSKTVADVQIEMGIFRVFRVTVFSSAVAPRARPAFMFAESTKELTYLARQLSVLRADQLWRLACWTSPFGLSDAEAQCVDTAASLAKPPHRVQAGAVMKQCTLFGWNTYGLHCIYKSIAQVASRLSTNHPTELRYILQLAIELHDPPVEGGLGEPAADTEAAQEEEEEADRELQPICPLDSEVAAGCLHSGQIHGVNLADLFNWQRLVTASPDQRPPCKDLFKKKPATSRPSSADKGPGLSSIEHLFTPVEPPACEEVGVDVVASLATEADSTKLAEPSCALSATTRSLFLSLFRSAPIENATPAAPANPLYPLALWQPDTYVGGAAASDTVEDDETNDGDDDTDSGGLGHGRWASGAARVGRDCVRCKARFVSLLRRRHHCRRCGHIFCAACCSERAPVAALIELGNIGATEGMPPTALVRVCVECAEFIRSGLGESLDQSILAL
ncbi:unnamed protein product [Mesocestoides corti]|uniref:FYVE-type domain-containing protein n=1 Tax=Mesocestoides corti TaxID=53468 RepID=A0A0R3UJV9_MESCO|nr:unnamed protein product [Mesocestoides corti]